jgi:hypothetical protein
MRDAVHQPHWYCEQQDHGEYLADRDDDGVEEGRLGAKQHERVLRAVPTRTRSTARVWGNWRRFAPSARSVGSLHGIDPEEIIRAPGADDVRQRRPAL